LGYRKIGDYTKKKKPGNYRGIMLLEAAYKIFAIIREVKQSKSRM